MPQHPFAPGAPDPETDPPGHWVPGDASPGHTPGITDLWMIDFTPAQIKEWNRLVAKEAKRRLPSEEFGFR